MDISSLESVKAAAQKVLGYSESLDVLIANAGVMALPESKTKDGLEGHFGSNHLGHFYFFNAIMSKVLESKSKEKRVVVVASSTHAYGDINLESPGYIQGTEGQIYDKWNAYGQSKTSNMLYALSLSKKLKSKGIKAFSLHPGVLQSPLWRNLSAAG